MPKNQTMRITGGSLVRRRFLIPPLIDDGIVRPTPDRVREAIFSMIKADLEDARVLDLFGGSGAHAFESVSRGAKEVRVVERDPRIAAIIKENIASLGIGEQCFLEIGDALKIVLRPVTELMDVIFLDPPYSLTLDKDFFAQIEKLLADDGIVVFRCFKKANPVFSEGLYVDRDRIYGGTRVYILRRKTT